MVYAVQTLVDYLNTNTIEEEAKTTPIYCN